MNIAVSLLLFLFITCVIPGIPGFQYDVMAWRQWAVYINQHGLANTYNSITDYPPFYQYILWIYSLLAGDVQTVETNIAYLRVFTLLFDFAGLLLIYKWIDGRVDYLFILCLAILNVAYSYNTVFWGQVDGILSTLIFACLYFLHKQRLLISTIMMVLAINMKIQALMFVPLWGLLLLEAMARTGKWKYIPLVLLTVALTQLLILLPFFFSDGGIGKLWKVISGLVGFYRMLSLNAFNFWYLVVPNASMSVRDDVPVLMGLNYNQIGLILFCTFSFLAFLPLLRCFLKQIRRRDPDIIPSREVIWCTAALIGLMFFFFNTQMHERYSHPAFIFITAYSFYRMRFGLYALFSLAYFLNLERVLGWLRLRNYDTLIFDPRFIASLFAICIIWLFVLLFRAANSTTIEENQASQPGKAPVLV